MTLARSLDNVKGDSFILSQFFKLVNLNSSSTQVSSYLHHTVDSVPIPHLHALKTKVIAGPAEIGVSAKSSTNCK